MENLVSPEWLRVQRQDPNLMVLDTRLNTGPHDDVMIEGARYFDLRATFRNTDEELPNTFPTEAQFQTGARRLGINQNSRIVICGNTGVFASPRAWMLFRGMGFERVAVLDGGLPGWIAEGGKTQPFKPEYSGADAGAGDFVANFQSQLLVTAQNLIDDPDLLILDARSRGRFEGTEPEPRAGLESGHINGSKNLPFTEVLNGTRFRSEEELKDVFVNQGIGQDTLVFSCGSGITANITLLAAALILDRPLRLYDGSWTEWKTQGYSR